MKIIELVNLFIFILFSICYFHQTIYILVGLFKKPKQLSATKNHRYAVLISARNEYRVIRNLIQSLLNQTYPAELLDIYVVADNCTDRTADVARKAGANVYERFNHVEVGKGYALNWLLKKIWQDHPDVDYEGFFVFDADNVVEPTFVEAMNRVFDNGYRVVTSYRNSKNYGENWISAGYSLWFLREAKYLNNPRMQLGVSCAISGTGFLVDGKLIQKNGGWIHHLLTEDIEFTVDNIAGGEIIGYCADAVLYDEQPVSFYQSYIQRLRWAKGFYQVLRHYGKKLAKGMLRKSFSCYDMLMTIMPAMMLSFTSVALNVVAIVLGLLLQPAQVLPLLQALLHTIIMLYMVFFIVGCITTITEWRKIYCEKWKRIVYMFTFPLFMLTYVPIAIAAIFVEVEWKPIQHSVAKTVDDIVMK